MRLLWEELTFGIAVNIPLLEVLMVQQVGYELLTYQSVVHDKLPLHHAEPSFIIYTMEDKPICSSDPSRSIPNKLITIITFIH